MEYRTPRIEEYEQLIDLWEACDIPYRPDGRDARSSIAEALTSRPEYWHAAYEHERLVGVVVGTDDGRKGWVNRLAVHPASQQQGVATRLLTRLETAFEANGIEVIAALIEDENLDSKAFFERHGYEKDSSITYFSKRESEQV